MIDNEIAAQIEGIARVLGDVVAGQVVDPYAADVLAGAISTLSTLAAAAPELGEFVAWDIDATRRALAVVGQDSPAVDPGAAPAEQLKSLRSALEEAIGTAQLDEAAIASLAAIFHARAARYPFRARQAPPRKE